MSFQAKYPGTCGDCSQEFLRGETVTYLGDLGVCHEKCPGPAAVCPDCFMALPKTGRCDCRD